MKVVCEDCGEFYEGSNEEELEQWMTDHLNGGCSAHKERSMKKTAKKTLMIQFLSGDYPSDERQEVQSLEEGIAMGSEILRDLHGDDDWFCIDVYEDGQFMDEPKAVGFLNEKGFVEILRDEEEIREFIEEKGQGDLAGCDEEC